MIARRGSRGFSLLEVVVAMAVFSVVALAGTSALRDAAMIEERISDASRDTGDLSIALRLLRRDLTFLLRPGADLPGLAAWSDGFVVLSSGVLLADDPPVSGTGLVVWLLDPETARLTRHAVPGIDPDLVSRARAAGSLRAGFGEFPVGQAVLQEVTDLQLRSHDGTAWRPSAPGTDLSLAAMVEVRIDLADRGPVRVVVAP